MYDMRNRRYNGIARAPRRWPFYTNRIHGYVGAQWQAADGGDNAHGGSVGAVYKCDEVRWICCDGLAPSRESISNKSRNVGLLRSAEINVSRRRYLSGEGYAIWNGLVRHALARRVLRQSIRPVHQAATTSCSGLRTRSSTKKGYPR